VRGPVWSRRVGRAPTFPIHQRLRVDAEVKGDRDSVLARGDKLLDPPENRWRELRRPAHA
jgi:hypothetical protein